MTPLHIQILLHYYCTPDPYSIHDPVHANSPAVISYRNYLIENDMLEENPSQPSGYEATEKAKVYIEALCNLPLPKKKWTIQDD